MMELLLFLAVWVPCGALMYANTFAWLQRSWPHIAAEQYHEDRLLSIQLAFFGPLGLMVNWHQGDFKYGLKWK